MKGLSVYNLTNLYTKTKPKNLTGDFGKIIQQSRDGVFGIEINMSRGSIDFTLVSPSFLKQNGIIRSHNKSYLAEDSLFLEGYLNQPFFMPICTKLDGEFIERVQSLPFVLKDNESVFIQLLFKRTQNWQEKAIKMYSSYILHGNNYPLTFNIGRRFQEKVINLTSKLGALVEVRDYIEEAEQKIASEGYCFKLNVVIDCTPNREEYLRDRLEGVFSQYTYYNTIKLVKVKNKNALQEIDNCIMTPDAKYQILSKREILSLIGGKDVFEDVNEDKGEVDEGGKADSNGSERIIGEAIELLPDYPIQEVVVRDGLIQEIGEALKRVGITSQARVYNPTITAGARLTTVQIDTPKGKNLTDLMKKQLDIQAALGIASLTIVQGEGKDTAKLLIPHEQQVVIGLRTLLEQASFKEFSKHEDLAFPVGVDETNQPIYLSLTRLRHLLISGSTGSGKSIFLNSLIVSLLLTNSPQKLKLTLIDPKMVEMNQYKNIPHVDSVITDMDKAEYTLNKLVDEMENRYLMFKESGVKNISLYNEKVLRSKSTEPMPFLVCIIDELADLMDTHPNVDEHIARLGQKARASGIHLVLCTQRPSSDIVSGRIKANMPNAISFNLSNSNNYKTIFGTGIPYTLLGKGDGVLRAEGTSLKEFQRFQSPIISPNESEEERVYTELADYLNKKYGNHKRSEKEVVDVELNEENESVDEDNNLYKLKQIIAETRETRTVELRSKLKLKNSTLSLLMKQLVDEGFLELGKSRQEGYKINEDKLSEWVEENM